MLSNRKELLLTLPKNGIVAELGVDNGEFSQKIIENCSPQKLYLVDVWDTERYNETKALNVYNKFSDQIEIGKVEMVIPVSRLLAGVGELVFMEIETAFQVGDWPWCQATKLRQV